MGHSLSGEIFYGIDLGDEESRTEEQDAALPQWWHDDKGWEDELATRLGWKDDVPYPCELPDYQETPEFQAWLAARDERQKLILSMGVSMDFYGYEYQNESIRVTSSVQSCDYGASRLSRTLLNTPQLPAWDIQIMRFCELMGIAVSPGDIDWYQCASWA